MDLEERLRAAARAVQEQWNASAGVEQRYARFLALRARQEADARLAPVAEHDLLQLDAAVEQETRTSARRIDRVASDQRLLNALAQEGFQGPRYDRLAEELARYGISVLRGWMRSGHIFELVTASGSELRPRDAERQELSSNSELREELATMSVASVLPAFRQRALIERGWAGSEGRSLTTYFMGMCVAAFHSEFRRHRAEEDRWRRSRQQGTAVDEASASSLTLADEVVGNLRVRDALRAIDDPPTRAVVALTVDGYSHEEIRQMLDVPSLRAVEGLLYRWRRTRQAQEADTLKDTGLEQ